MRTYNTSATVELGETQESSDGVVIHVQESCRSVEGRTAQSANLSRCAAGKRHKPRGFFFKTRKTVSRSSRYLKK